MKWPPEMRQRSVSQSYMDKPLNLILPQPGIFPKMASIKHYLFKKLNVPEPKSLDNLAQFIREHVKGDRRQVKMSVDI